MGKFHLDGQFLYREKKQMNSTEIYSSAIYPSRNKIQNTETQNNHFHYVCNM